ncbi:MAG TPA: hypothetical protein VFM65_07985 [Flavobacteriaceae bacterium]|nr:hypothetical protein [Flavobacteriaceae bacterium]
MEKFLKTASIVFHPVGMPIFGAALYFLITPKFFENTLVQIKLLSLVVLTIFVPLVFLFFLKKIGIVQSVHLKTARERRLPLLFFCVLTTLILNYVLNDFYFEELYYFYCGILFSGLTAFFLSLFKVKASLHLIGISGICMFTVAMSIYYQSNLIFLIAFLIFSIGWTAASRIQVKAHKPLELIFGFFIGVLPQLILVQYWL